MWLHALHMSYYWTQAPVEHRLCAHSQTGRARGRRLNNREAGARRAKVRSEETRQRNECFSPPPLIPVQRSSELRVDCGGVLRVAWMPVDLLWTDMHESEMRLKMRVRRIKEGRDLRGELDRERALVRFRYTGRLCMQLHDSCPFHFFLVTLLVWVHALAALTCHSVTGGVSDWVHHYFTVCVHICACAYSRMCFIHFVLLHLSDLLLKFGHWWQVASGGCSRF